MTSSELFLPAPGALFPVVTLSPGLEGIRGTQLSWGMGQAAQQGTFLSIC